jgi:hypothetical protein
VQDILTECIYQNGKHVLCGFGGMQLKSRRIAKVEDKK